MNCKDSKVFGAFALVSALLATSSTSAAAQSSASPEGLVGAWLVQVTLRNCETNAPMGSLNSLGSFHRGGTLSESPGGAAYAPGQRSDGHGRWAHHGANTYTQNVIALIRFDTAPNLPGTPTFDATQPVSPGFFAGWQTITHTIELSGSEWVSSGTNAFYKSDGTLYRTGCSSAVGLRFE